VQHGGDVQGKHFALILLLGLTDSRLGFKSQITRIPTQEFGLAILSNDESFGRQIVEAIEFRIIDEALKLEPMDWVGRYCTN
jgi:hypothetical protein